MRAFVTGATGFLGRHLAERLVARGDEVVGTRLRAVEHSPRVVELVDLDVRDAAAVAAAIAAVQPEAIFHLAALSHVGDSWQRPHDYYQVNVLGTEHVVVAAAGRPVLVISSAEVYGATGEREAALDEERPPAPRSPYALTKAAAERLALARDAVVARCFNLLGRGQATNFALPSFAAQLAAIARGDAPAVLRVGNLSAARDFVHVDDAVDAAVLLVERGVPGAIYNVASGEAHSIAEMLERLIAVSGLAVAIEVDPARLRPVDVPRLCGDARRLAALGWRARRSLDAALADLWSEAQER